MQDYIISCESIVDLNEAYLKNKNISYISYTFELDGKAYKDDFGKSIPIKDFYETMDKGADAKTTQINMSEFIEYFDKLLSTGKDLIHVCLSSGLSGVYNSALMAKEELESKYPNQKIFIVDSLAASSGAGLLVDKMAEMRDAGENIENLYNWVEENKLRINHWFFSSDLKHYIKGGRVSKTAGTVGGILGICPVLNVSVDGKLIPRAKVRSKSKTIDFIVDKMVNLADGKTEYCDKCFISNSNCPDLAQQTADLISKKIPNVKDGVQIFDIGTVIGSHTGPGTIALFFWGEKRTD